MTDEVPWWAPIRKALVKKAASIIEAASVEEWLQSEKGGPIVEAQFEDVPPKPRQKRRKALPARPGPVVPSEAPKAEK